MSRVTLQDLPPSNKLVGGPCRELLCDKVERVSKRRFPFSLLVTMVGFLCVSR